MGSATACSVCPDQAPGTCWRMEPTVADIERAIATAQEACPDAAEFNAVARALLLALETAQTSD